jgi:uncharacterized membrane protein YesL
MSAMSGPRVLWRAVVGLWDETLAFLGANLLWFACNLPFGLLLVLLLVPVALAPGGEAESTAPPFVLAAWLLLFLPTPGMVGLGAVAEVGAGLDAPRTRVLFWPAVRRHWRQATAMFCVSLLGTALLLANMYFYALISSGWLRVASILWLYLLLFWLGMQLYLVPLLLHLGEVRLIDLYRRAALITLGHPISTLVLVIAVVVVGVVSVLLLPAYLLLAGSFVGLVQAHALRAIRRKHGELPDEETEPA